MQTINSLEKRLENLENVGKNEEGIILIFVECDNTDVRDSQGHIYARCKAACEDEATFDKALSDAFVAIHGNDPFLKSCGVSIIVITEEIAKKLLEILRARGIEVKL